MNNPINNLYQEEDKQKANRQVNIDLLRNQLSKASDTQFEYKWFINELRSYLDNIETANEVIDDIYSELDEELKSIEL